MSTTPTTPVWTLHGKDITGEGNGKLLAGCHITVNDAGTAYEFTKPRIQDVLSTTLGSTLPVPPFTFIAFAYKGFDWTIEVKSIPLGAAAHGTWATAATPPHVKDIDPTAPQSGEYTAQAGGTVVDDNAASSAGA